MCSDFNVFTSLHVRWSKYNCESLGWSRVLGLATCMTCLIWVWVWIWIQIELQMWYDMVYTDICYTFLTHWGRVTHICVTKLTIIVSDNGLSPGQRQPIVWTNVGILLTGPLWTNFIEILIEFQTFSLKKRHLKLSSEKCRPFCLGVNVLNCHLPMAIISCDKLFTYASNLTMCLVVIL